MEQHTEKPMTPKRRSFRKQFRFDFNLKNIFIVLFVLFLLISFFASLRQGVGTPDEKPLSQIVADVRNDEIDKIEVEESQITVTYRDGGEFMAFKEAQESIYQIFSAAEVSTENVEIVVKDPTISEFWIGLISNVLPIILMVGIFLFIFRQARGAQDSIFSFGQSRAKLFRKSSSRITFKDVAGVDEAKQELQEVVDFLKNPKKYRDVGARTPKGVILVGPAGTGKTLLAKAVAGEANVPFMSIAGSEFMEMLVGVGASRVRDLFATAKKSAPSIIFIDEIDAIGRSRSIAAVGGHDEREQTLNQILVEMDGFEPNERVVVVAATNRGDLLDSALLRPGRFDRRVMIDLPDIEGRKAILGIHMKGKPFAPEVDWDKVARRTVGFSGADLENMLNEAAIGTARENKKAITMAEIEEAATKVKLGPEKRRLQSPLDRKMTAYHEAGHAVVTHALEQLDPVHRISIVSRGVALGFTLIPPSKDRIHETKSRLIQQIASMLGGRAAEELIFDEFTTGASNDIDKATHIARQMVIEYGMSDLGPINFGPDRDAIEWRLGEQIPISPQMQDKIDTEIKQFIDAGYKTAIATLKKLRKELDTVAQALVERESLDGDEFEKLMGFPKKALAKAKA